MRTTVLIVIGCSLWTIWLLIAKWVAASAEAMTLALGVFSAGWLFIAAANLWFGVAQAGYAVGDELPIFLLIFAVPVIFASFVKWKWFSVAHR